LHAKADQEHAGDLFKNAPITGLGAQPLGQEMRQQHDDQSVQKSQHGDGGRHDAESHQSLVARRIDEQRKERHVEDDGLGIEQRDRESLLEIEPEA
jgi:hypothetical protein